MQFIAKYNKEYDRHEFYDRFEIFKENEWKIEAHNQLYKEGLAPFDLTVNKFTDLTE